MSMLMPYSESTRNFDHVTTYLHIQIFYDYQHFQVPDDLCKPGYLLDNLLPAEQTLSLLRLICHTNPVT